jgi:hypothetical protein
MQGPAPRAAPTLPPLRLLVERRFPLELNVTLPQIRELYDSGKAGRWNPQRDIDWSTLHADAYDAPVREAARRTWSRRLWMEVTGLTETPALLVRFCMETGRESDPKFFLAVRNTEEAWHIECCERITEAFGGRLTGPADRGYENAFNRNLHRRALDAEQHLDAYVACFAAFEDGLELELCRSWRANATNAAIAAALDHIIGDKERHAAFGWLYLASRAPRWSQAERELIADQLTAHIRDTELKGYHCPWLAPEYAAAEAQADAVCAAAGLGAATRAEEEDTMMSYVANARQRLGDMGVALPMFETNRMHAF